MGNQIILSCEAGYSDRVMESQFIGGAMALYNRAIQS
jgi:hypothetical protein